jgi:hypothetical protein
METIPQLILSMISISFNWRSGEDINYCVENILSKRVFLLNAIGNFTLLNLQQASKLKLVEF